MAVRFVDLVVVLFHQFHLWFPLCTSKPSAAFRSRGFSKSYLTHGYIDHHDPGVIARRRMSSCSIPEEDVLQVLPAFAFGLGFLFVVVTGVLMCAERSLRRFNGVGVARGSVSPTVARAATRMISTQDCVGPLVQDDRPSRTTSSRRELRCGPWPMMASPYGPGRRGASPILRVLIGVWVLVPRRSQLSAPSVSPPAMQEHTTGMRPMRAASFGAAAID